MRSQIYPNKYRPEYSHYGRCIENLSFFLLPIIVAYGWPTLKAIVEPDWTGTYNRIITMGAIVPIVIMIFMVIIKCATGIRPRTEEINGRFLFTKFTRFFILFFLGCLHTWIATLCLVFGFSLSDTDTIPQMLGSMNIVQIICLKIWWGLAILFPVYHTEDVREA